MKRVLGIDLGSARIGFALSDELGMLAHPHSTLKVTPSTDIVREIVAVADAHHVEKLIVGMPRNMDGTSGPAAAKSSEVCRSLEALGRFQVVAWDERLTTVGAQRLLHESGRNTKKSRAVIDQVAAQLLLQSWLDSQTLQAGGRL